MRRLDGAEDLQKQLSTSARKQRAKKRREKRDEDKWPPSCEELQTSS